MTETQGEDGLGERTFYVDSVGRVVKAMVVRRGFFWSRVLTYRMFDGIHHKRVPNRRLLTREQAERYEEWREALSTPSSRKVKEPA